MSDHFTLQEMTFSDTAVRKGIDNTPTPEVIENLKALCINVLEPLREAIGRPIRITSGYRSAKLNKAIGGVPNSAHQRGEAADIQVYGMTPEQVFDIARRFDFDQCIWEPEWVHVSWVEGNNRKETLKATRVGKKMTYTAI